ncbi:hypothetical protein CBR_g17843 [Chara braunii]|uniref:Uncharacterized protein n=1 Tax=Chara braunii TaxID=69332 RepID=A0A388KVX6_CHABU|nr:hypothetical protein CBR_g17843 [Chara braunii]|eukprot:GBG74132.1 hypothetical protein CBR_g17843 [Chara braunii]
MMTMMTWYSGDDLDDDVDDGQVTTSKQGGSGGFEPLRYQCNEPEAEDFVIQAFRKPLYGDRFLEVSYDYIYGKGRIEILIGATGNISLAEQLYLRSFADEEMAKCMAYISKIDPMASFDISYVVPESMATQDGLLPSGLCIGTTELGEDFARLDLDEDFSDAQTEWLRDHAVTVQFHQEVGNLSNNIKKQLSRVYENSWYDNGDIDLDTKRGRYQNEGKNLATYVASTKEIADWLRQEGGVALELKGKSYDIWFIPWMDLAEMKFLKSTGKPKIFWIRCLNVPLQLMAALHIAVEQNFGKVVKLHPFEEFSDEPEPGNVRFDLDPLAELRVKRKIIVGIPKKGEYHIEVISAATPWCNTCRMHYHTKTNACCLAKESDPFVDPPTKESLPLPPFSGFVPMGQTVSTSGWNRYQKQAVRKTEGAAQSPSFGMSGTKNDPKELTKGIQHGKLREKIPVSKSGKTSQMSKTSTGQKEVSKSPVRSLSGSSEKSMNSDKMKEDHKSPVNKINIDAADADASRALEDLRRVSSAKTTKGPSSSPLKRSRILPDPGSREHSRKGTEESSSSSSRDTSRESLEKRGSYRKTSAALSVAGPIRSLTKEQMAVPRLLVPIILVAGADQVVFLTRTDDSGTVSIPSTPIGMNDCLTEPFILRKVKGLVHEGLPARMIPNLNMGIHTVERNNEPSARLYMACIEGKIDDTQILNIEWAGFTWTPLIHLSSANNESLNWIRITEEISATATAEWLQNASQKGVLLGPPFLSYLRLPWDSTVNKSKGSA